MAHGQRSFRNAVINAGRWILDAVFPEYCLACDSLGVAFCDSCQAALTAKPARRTLSDGTEVVALYPYADPKMRALLSMYKFRGRTSLRRALTPLLAKAIGPGLVPDFPVRVVPIPLFSRRQRERGFNQAEELARIALAHLPAGSKIEHSLRRVRNTFQQSMLLPNERRANLVGAFRAAAPIAADEHYLLVNDVVTTGETIAAAAAALRLSGARNVSALALSYAATSGDIGCPKNSGDN